jgi:hypothetical protein
LQRSLEGRFGARWAMGWVLQESMEWPRCWNTIDVSRIRLSL